MAIQVKNSMKKEKNILKDETKNKIDEGNTINIDIAKDYIDSKYTTQIDEISKENIELKETLNKQNNDFSDKFTQMQSQIDLLIKIVNDNSNKNTAIIEKEDDEVAVGCRVFAGLGIVNSEGTQTILFRCGEKKYISYDDMKSYLKENIRNNKALFANGLLFFYDEKNYERFKIKKLVDLTEENIIDILSTKDSNQLIRKFNTLTDNMRKDGVVHTFKYMVADLLIREPKKLEGFVYDNRQALEDYIGVKFDTLIANANMYHFIKCEK